MCHMSSCMKFFIHVVMLALESFRFWTIWNFKIFGLGMLKPVLIFLTEDNTYFLLLCLCMIRGKNLCMTNSWIAQKNILGWSRLHANLLLTWWFILPVDFCHLLSVPISLSFADVTFSFPHDPKPKSLLQSYIVLQVAHMLTLTIRFEKQ
jgi:hypothetical protein